MTLVLSLQSRDSIWVVVDRRLSYGRGKPPTDDAVKVMHLETTDGMGVLAYAGLGKTPSGTQPSEWMSATLRGRSGLTFERAMGVLSTVASRELPKFLKRMPSGWHTVVAPAFIKGVGAQLFTVDNRIDRSGKHLYRFIRHQLNNSPKSTPRLALAGTGGIYLAKNREWIRPLLSLAKAHDRKQFSDRVIADQLARLNYEAHLGVSDGTVGPSSIVVWRRRSDGRQSGPGGAHQFYTGVDRDRDSAVIPTISDGFDVVSLVDVYWGPMQEYFSSKRLDPGAPLDLDIEEINRGLAALPSQPDERLR